MSQLYVEITSECNLRCPYCYNSSGESNVYMDLNLFRRIVSQAKKNEIHDIVISGGEPLLHPRIGEIIDIISKSSLNFQIISNGLLAEKILLPYIKTNPNIRVQISLDGSNAHTNSYTRGVEQFDVVKHFLEESKKIGYLNGDLRMTVTRDNYKDIENYFYFALQYNFVPSYCFCIRIGRCEENWERLSVNYKDNIQFSESINKLYQKYMAEFKEKNQQSRVKQYFIKSRFSCALLYKPELQLSGCLIKCNGDVQPCQQLYNAKFTIGNINSEELRDLFKASNIRLSKIQKSLREVLEKQRDKNCPGCFLKQQCEGGCPAQILEENSFGTGCYWRKKEFVISGLSMFQKEVTK